MTSADQDQVAVGVIRRAVPDVVAVYRFGSSAKGIAGVDSDVDIALLAAVPVGPVVRFDVQEQLASALGRDVDLVDLRTASPVLSIQVIGTGEQLIFDGNTEARGRFEDLAYSAYARLNEERRGILERVAAEGTVYGR